MQFRAVFVALICLVSTPFGQAPGAEPPSAGSRPTLFLVGDSTVKNGRGDGASGLWGWGQVLQPFFDSERILIENRALGGRSSRTYLTEGLWSQTLERIRPGDYVLIQFGHNDGGEMFRGDRPRASIRGVGDETQDGVVEATGKAETVHTFGWYLRSYVTEAKAKGATPIVLSPVPRDMWKDGRVLRADRDYGKWAREAAEQTGALFVDLNAIVASRYERDGQALVHNEYFTPADHTHTSRRGAEVTAACIAEGVRALEGCDLREHLLPPPDGPEARVSFGHGGSEGFARWDEAVGYSDKVGFGFTVEDGPQVVARGASGCVTSSESFTLRVRTREGNHHVRVVLGSPDHASTTRIECELRRRVIDDTATSPGEFVEREFFVNTRTPVLPNERYVHLKPRELHEEADAWDTKLSLRFTGENPSVARIEVTPSPETPTVVLLGDSTVADQPAAPWASWGQKLPRHFAGKLSVANHSESGESIASAWAAGRCDKALEALRAGDWLLVQFGHNDMKSTRPNALERYREDLRRLVVAARGRGAVPVLVTSMERQSGADRDTLGAYPDAVRALSRDEGVALIDLHARSKRLYQALGDRLPEAFIDGTHHTDFGAELLAGCVVDGIREELPELAASLTTID